MEYIWFGRIWYLVDSLVIILLLIKTRDILIQKSCDLFFGKQEKNWELKVNQTKRKRSETIKYIHID